jgi:opacity protein-like surface antigen
MKKVLISSLILLSFTNQGFARDVIAKPVNSERETQLDLYSKTSSGQYKGELKKVRRKDEFELMEGRFYGGVGLRVSSMKDIKLEKEAKRTDAQIQAETGQSSTVYYDENKLDFDMETGFYGSLGIYWRNGLRTELEYAQTTYEDNSLSQFQFANGSDKVWEYLHNNSINVNSIPINRLEFDVKTVMWNFIYEPFKYDSKVTPYIGAGAGLVIADIKSLPNDGSDKAFGWQGMAGLAYKMGNSGSMYLGYRYIQSSELEQTFTRVVQVSGSSPNYTPYTIQSKESYEYIAHSIDVGFRFFF